MAGIPTRSALRTCAEIANIEIAPSFYPSPARERERDVQERMIGRRNTTRRPEVRGGIFLRRAGTSPTQRKCAGWADGRRSSSRKTALASKTSSSTAGEGVSSKGNGEDKKPESIEEKMRLAADPRRWRVPRAMTKAARLLLKGLIFPVIDHAGKVISFTW